MKVRLYLLLISVLALNGCATTTTQSGNRATPTKRAFTNSKPVIVNPKSSTTHTVQRSDTLYSIAKRYNRSVPELAALNGLSPPYRLKEGQVLQLPRKKSKTKK